MVPWTHPTQHPTLHLDPFCRFCTARGVEFLSQICMKYSRFITCQSNTSKGRDHDRLPNRNPKNGGMLISRPISRCLTNHSELCMSRLLTNQPRRISIYRLQRRPSFGFESSVSSTPMTNGDPVVPIGLLYNGLSLPPQNCSFPWGIWSCI